MKNPFFSFLFFSILFLGILPISIGNLHAQKEVDSAQYYYSVLRKDGKVSNANQAFKYYDSEYERKLEKGDSNGASYSLELIAYGKYNYGAFDESEENLVAALSLIDSKNDSVSIGAKIRILNLLGVLYRKRKAHSEAHKLYKKSFEIAEKTSDSISVINNIANLYRDQDNYKIAIDTLDFAYKMALNFGDDTLIAFAVDNLGFTQSFINHQEALSNIKKGLSLRLETGDSLGLYSSYRHLTRFYMNRNLNEQALQYAEKTLSVSYLREDVSYENEALGLLLELSPNPNYRRRKFLNDSLSNVSQLRANSYASMKFDVEKERERTFKSELEAEKERSTRVILQAVVVVIIVFTAFLFARIRSRHKKEKLREVLLTESRISKKVHDEVANDVYQVMAKLQSNLNSNDELLDDLDNIYTKTRDISKEHSLVDVGSNFGQQLDDLFRSYETSEISVVTQNNAKVDWNEISELKKKTIYKVLQELLTNMRKHSKASHALIRFDQMNGKISIHYKDNGVGCNLVKNNGLQNVENRMEALKGRITFESEPTEGFEAKMVV